MKLTIRIFFGAFLGHLVVFGVDGAKYTSDECIKACRDKSSRDNYIVKCGECAKDPPLDSKLCSDACVNTFSTPLVKICNQCGSSVPLTDLMCITACGKTYIRNFKKICNRCGQTPPVTPVMLVHSCMKKPSTSFLDTICDALCSKPPFEGQPTCIIAKFLKSNLGK